MNDDEIKRIESPAGNYYGYAAVWEKNGEYFIEVENYDGWGSGNKISKEFYDAWVKEFGSK